jgi:hypothetical protein
MLQGFWRQMIIAPGCSLFRRTRDRSTHSADKPVAKAVRVERSRLLSVRAA